MTSWNFKIQEKPHNEKSIIGKISIKKRTVLWFRMVFVQISAVREGLANI